MMPVSAAIIDAGGRLTDWNGGFESEFAAVRELLRHGAGFAQFAAAAVEREGFARDGAGTPSGDGRGTFEYLSGGRTVRVESTRTAVGGRMRIAAEAIDTGASRAPSIPGSGPRSRRDSTPRFCARRAVCRRTRLS